jgi:hypothetical protein
MVASISWETCGSDPAWAAGESLSGGSSASTPASLRSADPCHIQIELPDGELPGCVAPHHASDQRLRHIGFAQAGQRIPGARGIVVWVARPHTTLARISQRG